MIRKLQAFDCLNYGKKGHSKRKQELSTPEKKRNISEKSKQRPKAQGLEILVT